MELTPNQQFWWNWGAQAVIGASTFAAVIIALFGDWLKYKIGRPDLRLSLLSGVGEETEVTFADGTKPVSARWYHVSVSNRRRWTNATEVQIFLLRLEERDAIGDFKTTWTGSIPLKWRHMSSINPDPTRVVGYAAEADLVALFREDPTTKRPYLQLQPLIAPSPLDQLVKREHKCRLRVVLQAKSRQADSPPVTIEIGWSGTWGEKANAQLNLGVRDVTPQEIPIY